jgi:hypothetical protein
MKADAFFYFQVDENNDYDEKREKGTIKASVYLAYFKIAVGYVGPILLLFFFLASQVLLSGTDYWLAFWYFTFFKVHIVNNSVNLFFQFNKKTKVESRKSFIQ